MVWKDLVVTCAIPMPHRSGRSEVATTQEGVEGQRGQISWRWQEKVGKFKREG